MRTGLTKKQKVTEVYRVTITPGVCIIQTSGVLFCSACTLGLGNVTFVIPFTQINKSKMNK